jgi:hypothetical protein
VIRAALDQDVTGAHHCLAVVHDCDQLSLQHDRVVDRVGDVHAGMARVRRVVFRIREHRSEHGFGRAPLSFGILILRRDVDHAQHRPALRRQHAAMFEHRVGRADARGAADGAPDVVVAVTLASLHRHHRRRDAVFGDVRAAVGVDAGDDASHRRERRRHGGLR